MMKLKILSAIVLFAVSVVAVQGMSGQKEIIKVSGKCGMCETRIEKAALSVKGVDSAQWTKESGKLEVVYDSGKADSEKIQKAIARTGHDTELYTANDKVYDKLPECCKYERAKSSACCSAAASCGSAKEATCPEK